MPSTCRPVYLSRELQDGHARVTVLELVDVAEVAAEPEHPLGRFKDLEHRVASRVGPVDDWTVEYSILAEQVG